MSFYTSPPFFILFNVDFSMVFIDFFFQVAKTDLRSNLPRTQLRLEMPQARMPETEVRIGVREPWMQTHCGMLQM